MARILGTAGEFTSDEAERQKTKRLLIAMGAIAFLAFLEGATVSGLWAKLHAPWWLNTLVQCLGVAGMGVVATYGFRKLDETWVTAGRWQRGAEGESVVGNLLADFPDDFYIVNDLSTPYGNLDHLVVGPTGVFVLETKNWRGIVRADGKGELLLNGKPTGKTYVRQFVRRLMGFREKTVKLEPSLDTYFDGVLVFTSARVEANWGTTGAVKCIREDQLWDYIVEKNFGRKLTKQEVRKIARTFKAMKQPETEATVVATTGSPNESNVVPIGAS